LLDILGYSGTFVFALTGAFKARKYKLDIFGAAVVAFVTAYGGGTLRDLLIGIKPVNWINDNIALCLVLAGTIFTFLLKENVSKFDKTIFYTDAIGLGFFTAWGIEIALQNSVNEVYALVMGVITATFGGLLADLLCNAIPNLLKKGELYATACAIGGVAYLLLKKTPLDRNTSLVLCILIIVGIRIFSKRKRWSLPEI
jgi:uncharacterized membrane protein YeiH